MRYFVSSVSAWALVALALLLWPGAAGAQTQLAQLGRRPRFMQPAPTTGAPEEIDITQVIVLRRRVALNQGSATVAQLLREISRQTGLRFAYNADELPVDRVVGLRADSITVAAALTEILVDAGVDVLLKSPRQAVLLRRSKAPAQAGSITGRVTDAKTQTALAGATVVVQGSSRSATTGNDGRYRIAEVAPGTYTVRARYIGYAPGSASVTVSADQEATADLALEKSVQRLDEVVTTGTITETQVRAIPNPITVITGDEIREKHIQGIDQLFRGDVPGVLSWNTGSHGDQTVIATRGGSDLGSGGALLKTYVDGVEVYQTDFLSTIDVSSIDRVELIRGPEASTLYGSEAIDGVLQIFTKHGSVAGKPVIQGRAEGGAVQTQWSNKSAVPTYRGQASVSGGSGTSSYSVGASHSYTGDWVPEYGDVENNVYGNLTGNEGWVKVELTGRLNWQARSEPLDPILQPYQTTPLNAALNYQDGMVGITARASATRHWQHNLTLGYDRFLQEGVGRAPRFRTPGDTLVSVNSFEGQKLSFLYTTTWQGTISRAVNGSVTGGVNLTTSKGAFFAGNASPTTQFLSAPGLFYAGRSLTGNRGYFAQGQLGVADALFLTAGLRAESNDYYGQNYGLAWSPRAGLSYVWKRGNLSVKARASYGKAIRAPMANERYGSVSPGEIVLPSPTLGPEMQRGVDAGIEVYAGEWGALQATYYNQTAGGLIDLINIGPATFQYQNVGEIKNKGIELQGSLSPTHALTLTGTFTEMTSEVQKLSPSYTGDLQIGDQLLGVPRHTLGGSVQYALGGWTTNLTVIHSGTLTNTDFIALYSFYFGRTPFRGSGRDYWITYPAFTKLRLALSRRISAGLTAFVAADNLTNSYAYERVNYWPTIGRTTTAGLDWRF